jgi:hypothetical protein
VHPRPLPLGEPPTRQGVQPRLLDEHFDRGTAALIVVSCFVGHRSPSALPPPERSRCLEDELTLELRAIELESKELWLVPRIDQAVELERRATLEPGRDAAAARHALGIVFGRREASLLRHLARQAELQLGHEPRDSGACRRVVDRRREIAEALGPSNGLCELPSELRVQEEHVTSVLGELGDALCDRRSSPEQRVERPRDEQEPGHLHGAALLEARRDRRGDGEPRARYVLLPFEQGVLDPFVLLRERGLDDGEGGEEREDERRDDLHPRSSELAPPGCGRLCDP